VRPEVEEIAKALEQEQRLRDEVIAWRNRFPAYVYRPQDGCIVLRQPEPQSGAL